MKIVIIGHSGSGKSSLSKSISIKYKIPLLYMDCVHFLPGWNKREVDEERKIVGEFLKVNDNWVIDGSYFKVLLEERLESADKIILLDFNRFACLFRAYKRSIKYKNEPRESMAYGCKEVIDWAFIKHILFERKKDSKMYQNIKDKYKEKLIIIKNQKELDRLYKDLNVVNFIK